MKMKLFGLTETKLFHFHRIFKNGTGGGGEVGSSEPPEPPLDPPLEHTCLGLTLVGTPEDRFPLVEAHFVSHSPATAGADTIGRKYEHYRLESAESVHFRVTHLKAARLSLA